MDKNAIKKYAVWARQEFISRVTQKALQYGITDKEIVPADAASVNGVVLTAQQKKKRQALIAKIEAESFEQVMEEVSYTWFNRFSALRFMEVNGYLPTHVRVFTDEENRFKPQILAEAINLEIEGLDMEKVYALKDANDNEALFKYLIITQCNALSSILPGMFQKIDDYTELLFPDNLLREGSAIEQMIALIPEDDWKDAVQIIGWLYQYYNSEKKDEVFAALKKNIKITKENIPAATQLFTPDWIVRYMVENSLGRLWVEGHPNEELKSNWKYYLEEAEQEPDVQVKLAEIRKEYAVLKPEDMKCIDPCMGSGHILAYLFDVLMQIYEAYGYSSREAVASIVKNNIYGLDIDDRATQLANFVVMMKARQYDRRFFSRGIQPHVYAIVESNHVDVYTVDYFANGDTALTKAIKTIIEELYDAKEYGSILTVTQQDWDALYARFDEIREDINISREAALNELLPLVQVAQALARKYDVVVTNPPYMGSSGMSATLGEYVKKNYPDTKSDLSTVFMERTIGMCQQNGYMAMINIPVWMFISSYHTLRSRLLNDNSLINMLHFGRGVFGSDFGSTSFVISKNQYTNYVSTFQKLYMVHGAVDSVEQKEKWFFERVGISRISQLKFCQIPGKPFAYWVNDNFVNSFSQGQLIGCKGQVSEGIKTGDNERYLRLWHEVADNRFSFAKCNSGYKWYPYHKGGDFRKWYGNNTYAINWETDGFEIKKQGNSGLQGKNMYFSPVIGYSKISARGNPMRYFDEGVLFDSMAPSIMLEKNQLYTLGLLNSTVGVYYIRVLNPTMATQVGDIKNIPVIIDRENVVENIVRNCVSSSTGDWNSFENSWGFSKHPLLHGADIETAFCEWERECATRFNTLKANEEELNRIFIDIYGLADELTPEVEDKDVTVHYICDSKETAPDSLKNSNYLLTKKDVIKSLISYAVGCMFGRYSLDVDGLAYAGGEWDASKYSSFPADMDNVIPICDDEYFTDDIVGRFVKFIETVYGKDSLKSNLKFIADALGGKGTPKEVLRNYFLNDFFADHCRIYQKRPIYWLFDSGKKGGFKALIYMHRYQPDTIARIRTDYVHEQQSRYRTAIADLENRIADASTSERVRLTRQLSKLQDQSAEILTYEEKIHHLADQYISIDLDDGVKKNYEIFQDVLAKIK